jgi:hypothetical protein
VYDHKSYGVPATIQHLVFARQQYPKDHKLSGRQSYKTGAGLAPLVPAPAVPRRICEHLELHCIW